VELSSKMVIQSTLEATLKTKPRTFMNAIYFIHIILLKLNQGTCKSNFTNGLTKRIHHQLIEKQIQMTPTHYNRQSTFHSMNGWINV
jgi:hypothetical protein